MAYYLINYVQGQLYLLPYYQQLQRYAKMPMFVPHCPLPLLLQPYQTMAMESVIWYPDWAFGNISAYLILSLVSVRGLWTGFGLDDWTPIHATRNYRKLQRYRYFHTLQFTVTLTSVLRLP
jgi:hypothetical protein